MEKGDSTYQVMEYLDVPVGNILPVLQGRAGFLKQLNVAYPNSKIIGKDVQAFSENYFRLLRLYSKFGVLGGNIKKEHGRDTIEKFKITLGRIKEPFEELEILVTQKEDSKKIQELGQILYDISSDLKSHCRNFDTPLFTEYRKIRHSK